MFEPLHIVAATVAVAVTGRAVSTLRESLQLLFEDRQCCKFIRETVKMFSPVPVETTVWRPLYILILAV